MPPHLSSLNYSQIIAGAIRGALEAIHFKVYISLNFSFYLTLQVYASVIENPSNTEIRIKFDSILKDNLPAGEE